MQVSILNIKLGLIWSRIGNLINLLDYPLEILKILSLIIFRLFLDISMAKWECTHARARTQYTLITLLFSQSEIKSNICLDKSMV